MRNWVPERMTLKIHPKGSKGLYEDNLSRVAGVEVEIRKEKKDMRVNLVAGVKVEVRKTKRIFFLFKIMGKLGSKITTATIPWQRRQKCLLVFLNSHREIRKLTEIPL